jgi:hypothetical protein
MNMSTLLAWEEMTNANRHNQDNPACRQVGIEDFLFY